MKPALSPAVAARSGPAALASLAALLAPGLCFGLLLTALYQGQRGERLPLGNLFVMALAGGAATVAGALDWRFHRRAGLVLSRAEQRAELAALALGAGPLFAVMAAATLTGARWLLLPAVVLTAVTTWLIAYDEVRFHKRCGPYETALHRVLVLGQLAALLAWMHWCFVLGTRGA